MSAHYFAFSREFVDHERLCGECRLNYDAGEHIEINVLKPYTRYVCPNDADGRGHSAIWTGAHIPSLRRIDEHLCVCGAELVEEDSESWELSWEMQWPESDHWHPVSKVDSRHATHQQHAGLLGLIESGEPIRNVTLKEVAE